MFPGRSVADLVLPPLAADVSGRRVGPSLFTASTTGWAYGLASQDPDMMMITRNVIGRCLSGAGH